MKMKDLLRFPIEIPNECVSDSAITLVNNTKATGSTYVSAHRSINPDIAKEGKESAGSIAMYEDAARDFNPTPTQLPARRLDYDNII